MSKETTRVDLLKVRQKLADMYPPNSVGRKNFVKTEKQQELSKMSVSSQIFPKPLTDALVKSNKLFCSLSLLSGLGYFAMLLVQLFGMMFCLAHGFFGMFCCFGAVSVYAGVGIITSFTKALQHRRSAIGLEQIQADFQKRIDKLTKDLKDG